MTTLTYKKATALLGTARDPEKGKPIANNTRLFKRGDNFVIRLHDTDIITIKPNGSFVLNSGGYKTRTTKDRLNEYSPANISTKNHVWSISSRNGNDLFFDGIEINPLGVPINSIDSDLYLKCQRKLSRMIKNYIDGWINWLKKTRELRETSSEDCFYCHLSYDPTDPDFTNINHLLSHLTEQNYVPSLLWNAILEYNVQFEYEENTIYKMGGNGFVRATYQWKSLKREVEKGAGGDIRYSMILPMRRFFTQRREHLVMALYREGLRKK